MGGTSASIDLGGCGGTIGDGDSNECLEGDNELMFMMAPAADDTMAHSFRALLPDGLDRSPSMSGGILLGSARQHSTAELQCVHRRIVLCNDRPTAAERDMSAGILLRDRVEC